MFESSTKGKFKSLEILTEKQGDEIHRLNEHVFELESRPDDLETKVATTDEILTKAISNLTIIQKEKLYIRKKVDDNYENLTKLIHEKTRIRSTSQRAVALPHLANQMPGFSEGASYRPM